MARRWTTAEENFYREQLMELYIRRNLTIREVGIELKLCEQTVYDRLCRLSIPTCPELKSGYLRRRKDISIPSQRSSTLAEFFGVMLGDGHISHFQTIVTLGTKELEYVQYVAALMQTLFKVPATVISRADGYRDVYIGSVELTGWLRAEGLVSHKVKEQVDVPGWIFENPEWMTSFLRGFFDTDGSIYRLRFGRQISLTNRSMPILLSLRRMLLELGYKPSVISADRVYLTRRGDVDRFFREVSPANQKHIRRYEFMTGT